MAQRPIVPSLGTEAGGLLGPESDRALQQVLQSASGVLEARKAKEILQGALGGMDFSSFSGLGNLMEGIGTAYKAMAESQTMMTKQMLELMKDQKNGHQGNELLPALLALMNQQTQLIVTLLQEREKQSEERWRVLLEQIREYGERERQRLEAELERLKSSASPVEATLQGQVLPALVSKLAESWTADPITQLGKLAKQVQDLKALGSLFAGTDREEYTEGRLRWEELQLQKTKILREYEARLEEVRARREMWQNLPKVAQSAAEGFLRVLGGLGFVPVPHVNPEAEAMARALYEGREPREGRQEESA